MSDFYHHFSHDIIIKDFYINQETEDFRKYFFDGCDGG